MKKKDLIVVRGAGDLATGTIHRLKKAGFRLLVLEAEHPAAIRRQVALSEAVYAGSARVEDVEAVRMDVDLAEKKEPERTSGTGNGTDLEERWCSGARGSGGTKHCSTSPGRRGRCDSGEEKSRDDKRDGAACDCPRTGLYGRRRCGCCN